MVALKDLFKNPTPFELDLVERYAGLPLSGQRERNFEAFAATGLPTKRVETWKYSNLRDALSSNATTSKSNELVSPFETLDDAITLDLSEKAIWPSSLPKGLRIFEKTDGQALGGAEDLPVAALGAALADAPNALMIEVSETLKAPLHITCRSNAAMAFSRVVFVLREGVELNVFESHLAESGFSSRVVEYGLEASAKLNRVVYQNASTDAVQVFTCLVHLNTGAEFSQTALGFGARLCRNETRLHHHGKGAKAKINAAYLVGAGRHYDQTSFVRHSDSGCETRQLCKGAVLDEGQAVFQGKFFVARRAQQTDAEMAHHALILENGGEVNAKPELEIYADDVQCAHGNTVGALDENALFYMRQRGIPETEARSVLTEAFIAGAFDDLDGNTAETLISEAQNWLRESFA